MGVNMFGTVIKQSSMAQSDSVGVYMLGGSILLLVLYQILFKCKKHAFVLVNTCIHVHIVCIFFAWSINY